MSDNVDTSPLGIERTERIAGDAAVNSKLDIVTTELQNTQASVTTEVMHRSEGDLVVQRILEGYIQDLLDGKADDFERYIEFQNSQNLNYADVRNFVSSIRTSLADEIRNLSTRLMDNLQANDARYNKLVSDVGRYLEILSDITLDSNQITLDNGELRAGAWTILSQARAWDLEIISRLNGLTSSVGDSLKDAVEEIQNQLPSTEATISKAIEELSKSPIIKNLADLLDQSIENDIAYAKEMVEQARKHANDMAQLAGDLRAEAQARAASVEAFVEGEVTARIQEINKEVAARKEAINLLTEDMLTRVDQDKADFQADMLAVNSRIKSAEDGLTSEIQHRKDGDTSTLNALNTYKVSNDSAITGLSTSLSNNVTKTNANTTLITGLTSRIDTAEDGIESATTAAADAMSKATTAVSANSALSTRVDALAASLTESDGTVVDVNAFNALKAEVTTVQGVVTGLTEDVTALESNYTSVNNKVASQGSAIETLNTKMTTAEGSISQSANDITLLKTDISSINAGLLTKVDSQAFSQLSSDVSELDGKYTTQAGLVTDLRGSLDTTNLNVSNAASAAQNALNTAGSKGKVIFGSDQPGAGDRLSQNLWIDTTGGSNTPKRWNGSAWVVVTDKVATDALEAANAATNLANTKADTSAFNSLDQKVTVMDGKVSTNTNSITSLNGKIAIVEGTVATKLDSSAIVNYYTKQQADDKALSTAAGQITTFESTLALGGGWMDIGREGAQPTIESGAGTIEVIDRTLNHFKITAMSDGLFSAYIGACNNSSSIPVGTPYVLTGKIRASRVGLYDRIYSRFNQHASESYIVGWNASSDWVTFKTSGVTNTQEQYPLNNIIGANAPNATAGDWVEFKDCRVSVNSDSITATNSQAIRTTETVVDIIDGKVEAQAADLLNLNTNLTSLNNSKLDASIIQQYRTAVDQDNVTSGQLTSFKSVFAQGGDNLLVNSNVDKPYNGNYPHGVYSLGEAWEAGATYTLLWCATHKRADSDTVTMLAPYAGDWAQSIMAIAGDGTRQVFKSTFVASNTQKENCINFFLFNAYGGYFLDTVATVHWAVLVKGSDVLKNTWVQSKYDINNAINANAQAISNTETAVGIIDGKVAAHTTDILNLNTGLTNLSNTKLEASIIQQYRTAVDQDSVTAGELTQFKSALKIGGDNLFTGTKTFNNQATENSTSSFYPSYGGFGGNTQEFLPNSLFGTHTVVKSSSSWCGFYLREADGVSWEAKEDMVLSFWANASADVHVYGIASQLGLVTTITANQPMTKYEVLIPKGKPLRNASNQGIIEFDFPNGGELWYGAVMLQVGTKSTSWQPSSKDNEMDTSQFASATALENLTTNVSNIDGVVSSHTNQINAHQASINTALDIITIRDTRNNDFPPSHYRQNYALQEVREFKASGTISLPTGYPAHCMLVTRTQWTDASGGNVIQRVEFDDPTLNLYRKSNDGMINWDTWSAWENKLVGSLSAKADASYVNEINNKVIQAENGLTALSNTVTENAASLVNNTNLFRNSGFDATPIDGHHWQGVYWENNDGAQMSVESWGTFNIMRIRAAADGRAFSGVSQVLQSDDYRYSGKKLQFRFLTSSDLTRTMRLGVHYLNGAGDIFHQEWIIFTHTTGYTNKHTFTLPAVNGALSLRVMITEEISQSANTWALIQPSFNTGNAPIREYVPSSQDGLFMANAAATVTTQTRAEVQEINGRVSSLSQQTTVLSTTVDQNTSKLVVQGNSIDGIKAEYFIKTDVNGLVAGYGLVNSGTASAFAVSAEAFFVGSPNNSKKPFMVLSRTQTINGVSYPAGTWIDTALIANATIGTAHIADASITNAKIGDATIESAKIKSIKADKIEVGNPLVGPITPSMVTGTSLTNAANLFNGDAAANGSYATYGTGTQRNTSGAETNYIQVDVGSTVSMPEVRFFFRGSTGRKTYIKLKASVDGSNWDYIMGSAAKWETIEDMPPGPGSSYGTVTVQASFSWYGVKPYRYLRIYGNGSNISSANELVAIIGNASGTLTKIGSEGILTGAITADKIQVDSLSAISANLGTIITLKDPNKPLGVRTVQTGGLIMVYDKNNVMRTRMGFW